MSKNRRAFVWCAAMGPRGGSVVQTHAVRRHDVGSQAAAVCGATPDTARHQTWTPRGAGAMCPACTRQIVTPGRKCLQLLHRIAWMHPEPLATTPGRERQLAHLLAVHGLITIDVNSAARITPLGATRAPARLTPAAPPKEDTTA